MGWCMRSDDATRFDDVGTVVDEGGGGDGDGDGLFPDDDDVIEYVG